MRGTCQDWAYCNAIHECISSVRRREGSSSLVTEGEFIQGAVLEVVISDNCLRTSFLSLTLPNLDKTWKAGTVLSYPSNQTSVKGSCFSHFDRQSRLSI